MNVFSTDQLAGHLNDNQRFLQWRENYTAQFGLLDVAPVESRPFAAHLDFAQFGPVAAGWFNGTLARVRRSRHEISLDARDELFLFFNQGREPMTISQRGREMVVKPGMPALLNYYESGESRFAGDHEWVAFTVPRQRLQALVRDVEDLVAAPLDAHSEAMIHLRRYAEFLRGSGALGDEPALAEHVGHSLLDLISLSLGARRDAADLGRQRGLRAARGRTVVAEIEAGFSNPGFCPAQVARKMQLSPRYLQDLLRDTGSTFVERVAELRLQKARRMLRDPACDAMLISDIAYACGFNEVPYFNRCFRKRFGASPRSFRASSA